MGEQGNLHRLSAASLGASSRSFHDPSKGHPGQSSKRPKASQAIGPDFTVAPDLDAAYRVTRGSEVCAIAVSERRETERRALS